MAYPALLAIDWTKLLDQVNDAVSHPDFHATVASPWFWAVSAVVLLFGLLRGKKILVTCYLGAIAVWWVLDKTILHDKSVAGGADSNIIVLAGGILVIAGIGIYFLLIRD